MKCSSCGAWIEDGSFFCTQCGAKIDAPVDAGNASGKSAVYIIAIVLLLALIGAEGWFAWNTVNNRSKDTDDQAQEQTVTEETAAQADIQATETENQTATDNETVSEEAVDEEEASVDIAAAYSEHISNIGKGDPAAYSFSAENDPSNPVCIALWPDEACFLSMSGDKISESWVATSDGIGQVTSSYRFFGTMDEAWSAYQLATEDGGLPAYKKGIHTYDYIIRDCTWDEAAVACHEAGGHLVTFETGEEYEYVLSQINRDQSAIYMIGGRSLDGTYRWLSPIGFNMNEKCNDRGEWMKGEPSFSDGDVTEDRMIMFYLKKENRWVWNDVPNDIIAANGSYSGKLGYICEYE